MERHLHIITHEIPWPAAYGGVIDLFHKIKALHREGIRIHLHCFSGSRTDTGLLADLCASVHVYERRDIPYFFHWNLPYIVSSRVSGNLLKNLKKDRHPVLFEGVHCAFLLYKNKLRQRKLFLRLHNVEHIYYGELSKQESNIFKKLYFSVESFLLKRFEKRIAGKATVLAVSEEDKRIYAAMGAEHNVHFLPVFIGFKLVTRPGRGNYYCLYHGNLSINENAAAAQWLLIKVFHRLKFSLLIAGKDPSDHLRNTVNEHPLGSIVGNPSDEELNKLIANAQINLVHSFNRTGIKIKLLHALFEGRFCIANEAAVKGSGLEALCYTAENYQQYRERINELFEQEFTPEMLELRSRILGELYDNEKNAGLLIQWIY